MPKSDSIAKAANPVLGAAGNSRGRAVWAGALLACVAVIVYLPALRGGFVWDDDLTLTANPLIKAADGLYRLWFTTEPTDYWPVTYSTLWVEWRLWGMSALGYHAVSVALHIADALLLWTILRRLRIPGAWLAAFIFIVHPVNVESVAWITQQKNLISMLFFLASIWWFLRTDIALSARVNGNAYLLSLLCFVLAMLSKGSVAMLPVVLLGLIAWHRRLAVRDLLLTAPFFVIAAILTAVNIWFQNQGAPEVVRNAGLLERLLGAGAIVWFYLYKALLPFNLIFVYPLWKIRVNDPLWWIPLLAAAGATAGLIHLARKNRAWARPALFAWGYFCVMLVPVMGFTDVFFMKYSLVADHYQHLAIIGVIAAAAAAITKAEVGKRKAETAGMDYGLGRRFRFPLSYFRFSAAAILLAILGTLTYRQCRMYGDIQTLYRTTIERNPDCWMARVNLGTLLRVGGKIDEAIAQFQRAIQIHPNDSEPHDNLGIALAQKGKMDEALAQFREALRLESNFAEAHANMASALAKMGRTGEATEQFQTALRINPNYAKAHYNLATTLVSAGRIPEALGHFEAALRLQPDYIEAHNNYGSALVQLGRLPEAVVQFQEALQLKPDSVEAQINLGNALDKMGREAEAKDRFEEALRLDPDNPEAHNDLGVVLLNTGRLADAIAQHEEALRLKPDYAEARNSLGFAFASDGRLPEAIAQYEEALRLKPDFAVAHNNLGIALARTGSLPEAIGQFEAALRLMPGLIEAHLNLANVLRQTGHPDEAKAQVDEAARLRAGQPQNP